MRASCESFAATVWTPLAGRRPRGYSIVLRSQWPLAVDPMLAVAEIARRTRRARARRGLSLAAVERTSGAGRATIARIERGRLVTDARLIARVWLAVGLELVDLRNLLAECGADVAA